MFIKMVDIDVIFDVPTDKIRIIALSTAERKQVHQYLEKYNRNVKKVSLKSRHFRGDRIGIYIKCYECDYKRVPINNYHYGVMKNNQDEWRSGECPKCGEQISFEPNYDDWDDVKCVFGNNIIAFGKLNAGRSHAPFGPWFKDYNRPSHATSDDVSKKVISAILQDKKVYEILAPTPRTGKRKVVQYIDDHLPI